MRDLDSLDFNELVRLARDAPPNDRLDLYRDAIARRGLPAVGAMRHWLQDPKLVHFALRVVGRAGEFGARDEAVRVLTSLSSTMPSLRAEVEVALRAIHRAGATDRDRLLGLVATSLQDYRASDLPAPTNQHVDRWVHQFPADVQLPLLREIHHVFSRTYISKTQVMEQLRIWALDPGLAGPDLEAFWRSANVFDTQGKGESQHEMVRLLDGILRAELRIGLEDCGSPGGPFLYIDDFIFSGGRVFQDLNEWLRNRAPARATVWVMSLFSHTYGQFACDRRLRDAASTAGKQIDFIFRPVQLIENRLSDRDRSDVLWPTVLPDNQAVRNLVAAETRFPFSPRATTGLSHPIFSSEDGRQLLERHFLLAGLTIRSSIRAPKSHWRPLGFSNFGLGFGSMLVSYRNCPNNDPLALWWGLGGWHALVPRKTYASAPEGLFDDGFI